MSKIFWGISASRDICYGDGGEPERGSGRRMGCKSEGEIFCSMPKHVAMRRPQRRPQPTEAIGTGDKNQPAMPRCPYPHSFGRTPCLQRRVRTAVPVRCNICMHASCVYMCVCVYVCVCVRACVRVCVCRYVDGSWVVHPTYYSPHSTTP